MTAVTRIRRCLFAVAACVAAFVFFGIFILTEQDPVKTTDLSTSVSEYVAGANEHADSGAGAQVDGGSELGVAEPSPSIFDCLLRIAGIRKWAHTVEFLALGIPVAIAALLWWGDPDSAKARVLISVLICACASLFDQTHKLFVPGREFDASDLMFDLLGYGAGIAFVFGVVGLVGFSSNWIKRNTGNLFSADSQRGLMHK